MSARSSCKRVTSRRLRAISVVKVFSAVLVIRLFAVQHTMDEDAAAFNIEQDPIVSAAQPVVTIEIRQPLDVSVQPMFEPRKLWRTVSECDANLQGRVLCK